MDPDGHFADYYDQKGNLIRNDGVNDGKSYVEGKNGTVELPRAEFRAEVGAAVERTMQPTADDKEGHHHEDGAVEGHDKSGNLVDVRPTPGAYSNPEKENAHVDLGTATSKLADVTIDCHVHPDAEKVVTSIASNSGGVFGSGKTSGEGRTTTFNFKQPPSPDDKRNATGNWQHIVVGARDQKVYFFDSKGVVATFPLIKFLTIK